MNPFKRASRSIKRNKTKNIILFCAILSLSSMMIASLIVRESVQQTEDHIEMLLQPAAMVVLHEAEELARHHEYAERGKVHLRPIVELSHIRSIAQLPYVKQYEFFATGTFFSPNLITYNPSVNGYQHLSLCFLDSMDRNGLGHLFYLRGVQMPYFLDLRHQSIEITTGRTFVQDEIDTDTLVVLISEELAELNQLGIGSMVQVSNIVFDPSVSLQQFEWHAGNVIDVTTYELEVIGLFRTPLDGAFHLLDDQSQAFTRGRLGNRIYVPNDFIESSKARTQEIVASLPIIERNSECFFENANLMFSQLVIDQFARMSYQNFFHLYRVEDMIPFYHAVQELLPDLHMIEFMDTSVLDIMRTLNTVSSYSAIILIISCVGIICILNLLVMLSIQSRKKELGIYVALGEKKSKVLSQMFLEIMAVSLFAFLVSMILGFLIADILSSHILQTQLITYAESWNPSFSVSLTQTSHFYHQGLAADMHMMDVLTGLSLRLNFRSILQFVGLGIVIVGSSILFSGVSILKLNPKKILSST